MSCAETVRAVRACLVWAWQKWRAHRRLAAIINEAAYFHFRPRRVKVEDWKEAGTSYVVVHALTGWWWWPTHHLCVVDLDFQRVVAEREFDTIANWSLVLDPGVVRVTVYHSMWSPRTDACSFWRFRIPDGQLEEDFAAEVEYWTRLQ